ncbi:Proline dehydrogenase [Fasciola gigantica]|uniref:Proline dehydrogenase n=1 Tax=Fasciola gigantica TaxID=46835 RepID=A0A504Z1U8_FASGI|nr:Proline dehydrogenase [Fasciola gigantica]
MMRKVFRQGFLFSLENFGIRGRNSYWNSSASFSVTTGEKIKTTQWNSGVPASQLGCATNLDFRNTRLAHISKTNIDLLRGIIVYRLCSIPQLVKWNKQLMECSRKIFGKWIFRKMMKSTFYGHFVAGEDPNEIKPVVARMRKYGVKSILDYSVEKDINESEAVNKVKEGLAKVISEPESCPDAVTRKYQTSLQFADRSKQVVAARTYFYESEYQCDKNMETFLQCIDSVSHSTEKEGFAAIKVTALGRPQLLLQMSNFIVQMERLFKILTGSIMAEGKDSITPLPALDLDNFRKRLEWLGVRISYDENVQWFTLLDVSGDGFVDLLDWSHLKTFEHDLARIFTIKNKKTDQTEHLVPTLTPDGLEQMRNMLQRMDTIAKHAHSAGVRVMVDAEQTYFQPAVRRLTMEMMRLFNRESAIIFNTYQCYLKCAREHLHHDLNQASLENFFFGAKLVRGAYIEQERSRAVALGYEDPICSDYDATSRMYESCVDEVLQSLKTQPNGRVAIMTATHNEDTIRYVLKRMEESGVLPEQRVICFGQLFGMCDHISFNLSNSGYSVYKYVPYGPVEEVLPYLSRRALENGSMLSKTKLERKMMWSELKRRIKQYQFFYRP